MNRTVIAFLAGAALSLGLAATPASARHCGRCYDSYASYYYYNDEYNFPELGIGCCGHDSHYDRRHHRRGDHDRSRRHRSNIDDDGYGYRDERRSRHGRHGQRDRSRGDYDDD